MTPTFYIKGQPVFVDAADLPWVQSRRWHLRKTDTTYYAVTYLKGRKVGMHEILAGQKFVDHQNCNGLDNRRENLRPCTRQQNTWNCRKLRTTCSSRFKGVSKVANRQHSFESYITKGGKRVKFGRFFDEIAAALCYDIAAVNLFGRFARPNFSLVEAALVHPESLRLATERCKAKGIIQYAD